ncbi:hypothetical protein G7K_0794-t1 [Saitoella complicata NRRL Y-17804]|uniref:Uncharacterized protein n=1 Tax=Saitoella complicata (strain BCRC 22490 / CBS 7301 / JCM 7358 / NBRC 10748 / NRRL Y-17804) TaxID=698492 RepID=A0A0E9N9R2_SAICN|nr:hypothetical protein G7K_0794-t1 [Saitoella complicata NRRL Y-17804]
MVREYRLWLLGDALAGRQYMLISPSVVATPKSGFTYRLVTIVGMCTASIFDPTQSPRFGRVPYSNFNGAVTNRTEHDYINVTRCFLSRVHNLNRC